MPDEPTMRVSDEVNTAVVVANVAMPENEAPLEEVLVEVPLETPRELEPDASGTPLDIEGDGPPILVDRERELPEDDPVDSGPTEGAENVREGGSIPELGDTSRVLLGPSVDVPLGPDPEGVGALYA